MNYSIQTQGLSKKYRSAVALSDLTLNVPEGAIYALIGANGAGKTTIVKLLMNIFRPTSGRASVLGIDCVELSGKDFTRIGYVSENQEFPEWMTVRGLLDYLRPFYPQWDGALEEQLISQFDLPLTRRIKHLSRGMRMKVAFASVLAYRPKLIVLDEPFSGLDPLVRDELIECLLDCASEATMFLSSHDLAEIESFATHVGYLERGRLLFSEDMSVLSDRFREVVVTLDEPGMLPTSLPANWLQLEASESVIRFIDSSFRGESTAVELASIFPAARDISFNAMSLRSIFLSVARSGRAGDEERSAKGRVAREKTIA